MFGAVILIVWLALGLAVAVVVGSAAQIGGR